MLMKLKLQLFAKIALVIMTFFVSSLSIAQCNVNSFTATRTNGTCIANGSISVQVPGAVTCTNWIAILTPPSGSEQTLSIPANGGPVVFNSLPAGSYTIRLTNGSSTIQNPTNPISVTTTYVPMSITSTNTAPLCPQIGSASSPSITGTLTINANTGGLGPFLYSVTSSQGTQTFGPTAVRSHTFTNLVGGEQVSFTVTDQPGVVGCETSQTQLPTIAPNNLIPLPTTTSPAYVKVGCPTNCNTYQAYFLNGSGVTWPSRVSLNPNPNRAMISINGAPAVAMPYVNTFNIVGCCSGFESPIMQVGDTWTATFTDGCDITTASGTVATTSPTINYLNQATSQVGCTTQYTLETNINVNTFCLTTATVDIALETPTGSGNFVSIAGSPFSTFNQIGSSFNVVPGIGVYKATVSDGCSSSFRTRTVVPAANGMDEIVILVDSVSQRENTGSIFIKSQNNNMPGNIAYPVTYSISTTNGLPITYTAAHPYNLGGTFTLNNPIVPNRQIFGQAGGISQRVIRDLPMGSYTITLTDNCGYPVTRNFTINQPATYAPVTTKTISCSNSSAFSFNMNSTRTFQRGRVDLYTDNGSGMPGTFIRLISNTNSNDNSWKVNTISNLASGNYVILCSGIFQSGFNEPGYSATSGITGTENVYFPFTIEPYQSITVTPSSFFCDPMNPNSGIVVANITGGSPIYPLTWSIYATANPTTALQTFTANNAMAANALSQSFSGLIADNYFVRVASACFTTNINIPINTAQLSPQATADNTTVCPANNMVTLRLPVSNNLYNVTWTDDLMNTLGTGTPLVVAVTRTATYTATYSLKAGLVCINPNSSTSSVLVTLLNEISQVGATTTSCAINGASSYAVSATFSGTASFTATGTGAPGTWVNNGNGTSTWTSNPLGTSTAYSVNIQDANTCNTLTIAGAAPVYYQVICPTFPATTVQCYGNLPSQTTYTEAEFETLGNANGSIGNIPCGIIQIMATNSADTGICPQTVTRTYTITEYEDTNNNDVRDLGENTVINTTNCTQSISVNDTTAPTGTAPANISGLQCKANVPIANILAVTDEADNCLGAVIVTVADTNNGATGCKGSPYIVTRTYTLTDCGRNKTDLVQTITVEDTIAPTGTAPANITGLQCKTDVPVANILAVTDEADNCLGTVIVTVADTNNGALGCVGSPYIVTRTYTLTDCGGNTTDLVQTITVEDTIAPVWTTVANSLNRTVLCGDATNLANAQALAPVATDCNTITYTKTSGSFSGNSCGGTYTNTWIANDVCLNTSTTFTQIITVSPAALPTMTAPAAIIVACGGLPAASTIAFSNGLSGGCLINGTSNASTFTATPNACGGTVTETWTATDSCGRALAAVSRIITISPAALPTMTAPAAITVACGGLPAASTIAFSNGLSGGCLISGTSNTSTFTATPNACGGTVTQTWTATTSCGRPIAAVSRIITISPADLPTMTAPAAITVACGTLPAASTIAFSNGLSGGCLINGTSNASTFTATPNACGGTVTQTWTATTSCGRPIASVSRIITISPAALPTMTAPAAITVACGALPAASTIAFSNGLSGGCLINGTSNASTFTATPNACGGTVTQTWTATDSCGKALAPVSRIITISPAALPTMTAPAAITVNYNAMPTASTITYSNGLAGGCLISGNSNVSTFNTTPSPCGGTVIETWTATDSCGRSLAPVTRIITINYSDSEPPIPDVINLPNITVTTCELLSLPIPTATDNCSGSISGVSNIIFPYTVLGISTIIWTYTDNRGNSSYQEQIIKLSHSFSGTNIVVPVEDCGKNFIILNAYDNSKTATQNASKGAYTLPVGCTSCDNPGTGAVGTWSISGPSSCGTATFSNVNDPDATLTGEAGTYVLTWTVLSCVSNVNVTLTSCDKINFDGANDHVDFNENYNMTGDFSIEAWIKTNTSTNNIQTIFSKRNANNSTNGYDLIVQNDFVSFRWNDAGIITSAYKILVNKWHHVAVTFTSGVYNLYIDGLLINTIAGAVRPNTNSNKAIMGAMNQENNAPNNPLNYFSGAIDEFKIWNVALNEEQIHQMMNQEIKEQSIGNNVVYGEVIPMVINGLSWSNLKGYYRMDQTSCGYLKPNFEVGFNGHLKNITIPEEQTAPLPYYSVRNGIWTDTSATTPWAYSNTVWNNPNSLGINGEYVNWNIVRSLHTISSTSQDIILLGLKVESGKITIANPNQYLDNNNNGQGIWITHYLKLDGEIDLIGKSQLLQKKYNTAQISESVLETASSGYIERDQQGQSNKFNYNYWSSPVSPINSTSNNTNYSVANIMKDGTTTTPQNISWIGGLNGAPTTPISLAKRWLYKFDNYANDYANWVQITENDPIRVGQGYIFKGTGATTTNQNYTFKGKPNNGTITTNSVSSDQLLLTGNPYPSALNATKFIIDNINSIDGTLYFWEHYSTNNTHVLRDYQGGYATRNLTGGIMATSSNVDFISKLGTPSRGIPNQYIPVGQGFFVNGKIGSGGTITYNNEQRGFYKENEVDTSNIMFRTAIATKKTETTNLNITTYDPDKAELYKRIRIDFNSSNNFHRQILLGFIDGMATNSIDKGYDGLNFDNFPNDMYFVIQGDQYIIQGVGSFDENSTYPIGIKTAVEGKVSIVLESSENFDDNQEIYIYDKLNDSYHDIKNEKFEIILPKGVFNNRFELTFKNNQTLSIDELNSSNNIQIRYLSEKNILVINNNSLNTSVEKVNIYNLLGQNLIKLKVENQDQKNIQLPIQINNKGVYIAKIKTSNGNTSKKLIIN
jgi:hypothetical protein